jgi:hypothetical protein
MDDPNYHETSPLAAELHRDAEVIHSFQLEYPAEFVDIKVDREGEANLVALLHGVIGLDQEAALRSSLEHGEELEIQSARWTWSLLDVVRSEVLEMANAEPKGGFRSYGQRWGAIDVRLRADQEPLAATLAEKFGDAVAITVGLFSYPPSRVSTTELPYPHSPVPQLTEVVFPDLAVTKLLTTPTVRSGEDGHGHVTLRNNGPAKIEFASDRPLVGSVADLTTRQVVGVFNGAIAGTGMVVSLSSNEETSIGPVFGTASRHLDEGYALRPGRYLVSEQVKVWNHPTGSPAGEPRVLQVPPTSVMVLSS